WNVTRYLWLVSAIFAMAQPVIANNGSNGRNGQAITLSADGTSQSYNVSGENGGDGYPGRNGRNASCYSEGGPGNVHQPSGGNGERGGNGGNGGNAGDVTVYYSNLSDIQNVHVRG